MSAPDPALPFALAPGRFGAESGDAVRIGARRCELVQVTARRDAETELRARLRQGFALDLPPPGRSAEGSGVTALWLQPRGWLVIAERGAEGALAQGLAEACGAAAAVVDQSHGRRVLTLAGARAPEVLARICRLDVHPRVFQRGRVAATLLAGLNGVLHQASDEPAYELIVFSTYARDFLDWLMRAAEEVGSLAG